MSDQTNMINMPNFASFDVFDKQSGATLSEQVGIEAKSKEFEEMFAGLVALPTVNAPVQNVSVEALKPAENNPLLTKTDSEFADNIQLTETQKTLLPQDIKISVKSIPNEFPAENTAALLVQKIPVVLTAEESNFVQEKILSKQNIFSPDAVADLKPLKKEFLPETLIKTNLTNQINSPDPTTLQNLPIEKMPNLPVIIPAPEAINASDNTEPKPVEIRRIEQPMVLPGALESEQTPSLPETQTRTIPTFENQPYFTPLDFKLSPAIILTEEIKLAPETDAPNENTTFTTENTTETASAAEFNTKPILSFENQSQLKSTDPAFASIVKLTVNPGEEADVKNSRVEIIAEPIRVAPIEGELSSAIAPIKTSENKAVENAPVEIKENPVNENAWIRLTAKDIADKTDAPIKIVPTNEKIALDEFIKQLKPLENQFAPESPAPMTSIGNLFSTEAETKPVLFFENQAQVKAFDSKPLPIIKTAAVGNETMDIQGETIYVEEILPSTHQLPGKNLKNILSIAINPESFPAATPVNKNKNFTGVNKTLGNIIVPPVSSIAPLVSSTGPVVSPEVSTISSDNAVNLHNDFPKIFREISNPAADVVKTVDQSPRFEPSILLNAGSESPISQDALLLKTVNIQANTADNKIETPVQLTEEQPGIFFNQLSMSVKKGVGINEANLPRFVENVNVFEQIDKPLLQAAILNAKTDEPQILKMRLRPAELGTIEIRLEKTDAGTVKVQFQTETEAARHILTESFEQLKTSLQNSGIQVEQIEVVINQFLSSGNERRENESSKTATAENQTKEGKSFGGNADEPDELKENLSKRLLSMRA